MGQFKLTDQITLTKYKNGRSIQEMLTQFFKKQGETSPTGDETGWSNTAPSSIQSNETLWIRTKITYLESNGSTTSEYSPSKQGYRDYTWENIKDAQDKLNNLQNQVDGVIDVWYGEETPTLNNYPAVDWDDTEKIRREGDLYYNLKTAEGYRFFKNGNTYEWTKIEDTEMGALVNQIKDLSDNKVSIYYGTEYPNSAQINDLWFPSDTSPCYKCTETYSSTATDKGAKWAIANYNTGQFKIQYIKIQGTGTPTNDDSNWGYTMPLFQNGWHIWQRTVILDDNNNIISFSTPVNFTNAYRTISEVKNYYLATEKDSETPTHDTIGWEENIESAQINKEKPYLWNYEAVFFSDASEPQKTAVTLIGNYIKEGKTIAEVKEYYYAHTSKTAGTLPTFDINNIVKWQLTPPTLTDSNPWLWNIEVIYYSEQQYGTGSDIITPVASDPALIGYKGKDGEEGVGASSVAIGVSPQMINGWIEILQSQQITLTATYFQGITNFSDDSNKKGKISYQWKKNGQNVSGGNQRNLISTLTNEDEEVSYTCECTYDGKLKASETVTFSRRYKSLSYNLKSLNPARRYRTVENNGSENFSISPTNLGLILYEIVDEHEVESTYTAIYAQTNNGSQIINYNPDSQSFEFNLQTWYENNCCENGTHPRTLQETIKFYLDSACTLYIGSIEFEDAMPDEYLTFLKTAHNITAAIDNNAMVFNTTGLSLYNGAFTIYNAPLKTLPSGNKVADIENTTSEHRVLYFDSTNARLVIKGEINALVGKIGGWTIDGNSLNYLPSGKVVGNSGTALLCPGGSTSSASIGGSATTNGWTITIGSAFGVTTAGKLYCNSAEITGTIKATSGRIGSTTKYWTLGEGVIYSGANSLGSSVTGTYLGTDGILNRSGTNYVKISNGTLEANNVNIVGGHITWGSINAPEVSNINGLTNQLNTISNAAGAAQSAAGAAQSAAQAAQQTASNVEANCKSYADSKVGSLDAAVSSYLGAGGTTIIGGNGIISPYIGGGYLNIASGNKRVIIDPSNLTKNGYIFQVHNGSSISLGIDSSGNATFSGKIIATSGYIGKNGEGWAIGTHTLGSTVNVTLNGKTYTYKTALFSYPHYYHNNDSSTNRAADTMIIEVYNQTDKTYSYPFVLRKDGWFQATKANITGEIHATSGDFTGKITANEGYIGGTSGWEISGQSLKIEKTLSNLTTGSTITPAFGTFKGTTVKNPLKYADATAWKEAQFSGVSGITADLVKPYFDEVGAIAISQTGWKDTISLTLNDSDGIRNQVQLVPYGLNVQGKYTTAKVISSGIYMQCGNYTGELRFDQKDIYIAASGTVRMNTADFTTINTAVIDASSIRVNGEVIHGSDMKLKKDIIPLSDSMTTYSLRQRQSIEDVYGEMFDQFIPVSYKRINEETRTSYGLIAQQILEVLENFGISQEDSDLVHTIKKESDEYYGVAYNNFIALLIHEVQKLKKRVSELENLQSE